jgi:hypothetical protein
MRPAREIKTLAVAIVAGLLSGAVAWAQAPAGDIAAQVRSQGYACDEPVTAKRDVRLSKPDSAVWVLSCKNATYRVRLDPNLAADVVELKRGD